MDQWETWTVYLFFFLFTSTTSTFTNKYDRLWPRKIYCILMGKRRQMPMFTSPKVATRHYSILNLCVSGWRFPCEFAHFNSSAKRKTPTIALFVYDTFYDTFYNAIRVFSFHSCWLDQKSIIQRTRSCFTTLTTFFSSNVFCSKTNWDVPELFSIPLRTLDPRQKDRLIIMKFFHRAFA